MTIMHSISRSIFILLISILSALPAFSQTNTALGGGLMTTEPASTTASYGSWVLRCVQSQSQDGAASDSAKAGRPGARSCEVVQTVQIQGQQQPIAQIAIGRLPDQEDLILTALLPVNVSLPGNVHVSGNGKIGVEEKGRLELSWTRCLAGSCAAHGKPDAAVLALFRAGTEGQLRFVDGGRQTVAIPLSWRGLDQAMTALEKTK
ncbi:invasion associated locus B family protein [Agrobacterium sp. 22-3674b3]